MPELPEVETTKNDLKAKVLGSTIVSVRTDVEKAFKEPPFEVFKEKIAGETIINVRRRAKNLILILSDGKNLLIHLRMTGHVMVADARDINGFQWVERPSNPDLKDPQNRFIHFVFELDNGKVIALCDLRKFAELRLVDKDRLEELFSDLGAEPMGDHFSFEDMQALLRKVRGPIKKVLLDQDKIAGIGNIYADEICFDAGINPLARTEKLTEDELRKIYNSTLKILGEAIDRRGTSIADFRDTNGRMGSYQTVRRVYKRKGEPCVNCNTPIERIVVVQRGTHFCPHCQPLRK